jgi:hypothetical protein
MHEEKLDPERLREKVAFQPQKFSKVMSDHGSNIEILDLLNQICNSS